MALVPQVRSTQGVLLVNCNDKICSNVLATANKTKGVKYAFRVSGKYNESGADVMIRMEGSDSDILGLEHTISRIAGVSKVRHRISCK